LREERRLKVFENRVLRRVFGPKRDEVTGEWRKLHNEELTKYFAGGKIKKNDTLLYKDPSQDTISDITMLLLGYMFRPFKQSSSGQ
jgi:hypothetical protein